MIESKMKNKFYLFINLFIWSILAENDLIMKFHWPSDVELHMSIKQGHDGGGRSSPATDPRANQALLFVMPNHFNEVGTLLVGLIHKPLQVFQQFSFESMEGKKGLVEKPAI